MSRRAGTAGGSGFCTWGTGEVVSVSPEGESRVALGGNTLYVLAAAFHGFEAMEADLAARTGVLAAVEVSVAGVTGS